MPCQIGGALLYMEFVEIARFCIEVSGHFTSRCFPLAHRSRSGMSALSTADAVPRTERRTIQRRCRESLPRSASNSRPDVMSSESRDTRRSLAKTFPRFMRKDAIAAPGSPDQSADPIRTAQSRRPGRNASIPMPMMMVIPAITVIPATIRHHDTAAQQHGHAGNQQKGFLHRVHLLGFDMNPA